MQKTRFEFDCLALDDSNYGSERGRGPNRWGGEGQASLLDTFQFLLLGGSKSPREGFLISRLSSVWFVLTWVLEGLLGISSRHISATGWNQEYPDIILAVQILLAVLGVVSVGALVRWLRVPVKELPV